MGESWRQGEHVGLIGPTGSGKTTVASDIVPIREWVCMLAVKRYDDTIDQFKKKRFKIIKKWPPAYNEKKVILWVKPSTLGGVQEQSETIGRAMDAIYVSGGWCLYVDEAGYIAGVLGLGQELGILLNQGRSSHISVVCCMTRPRSMVARIPAETINQCRHMLVFKYTDEREIKVISEICGMSNTAMLTLMSQLGQYDFLYVGKGKLFLVRNTR